MVYPYTNIIELLKTKILLAKIDVEKQKYMKEEFTPTDIEVSGEKYVEFCNKANEVINKRRDELDKEMLEMMKITQEIQEWEKEFDEKFGINLKHQKARLYSDGVYSQGREKDWESAEQEVEQIKSFISQKLKEQRSDILETVRKNLDDHCIYEVSAETLLEK
jgi:hypothetical protein